MALIEEWNKLEKKENIVVFWVSEKSQFQPKHFKDIPQIQYKFIHHNKKNELINYCLNIQPERFIFSQEGDIHLLYLCSVFKKRGCATFLSPDGAKYFASYNKKYEFFSAINDTYFAYKQLSIQQIFSIGFFLMYNYRYGFFSKIDHILVPNCGIKFEKKDKLELMPILSNTLISDLSNLFEFNYKDLVYEKAVLFFNQPLWGNLLIEEETKQILTLNYQFEHFYIKVHPSTSQIRIQFLKEHIGEEKLIIDSVPAEFYMAKFRESLFVSGWSTCLMHKLGENNRFYYTFNLFKKVNDPILNQIDLIEFPHVQFIKKLVEVNFNDF
jgi:hypothetical protein